MAAGPRQRRSRLTAREFAPLTFGNLYIIVFLVIFYLLRHRGAWGVLSIGSGFGDVGGGQKLAVHGTKTLF